MPLALRLKLSFIAGALMLFTGCAVWRPLGIDEAASVISNDRPSRVRVTLQDTVVTVMHPRISGNMMMAVREDGSFGDSLAVPLGEIRQVELRRPNTRATRIFAVTSVLVAALILVGLSQPMVYR